MDPNALERLMLDDALGVLADDVRALVAERVAAAGPHAAAEAEAWRETVALARRVLGGDAVATATPPALNMTALGRAAARRRVRRWAGRAAALAACLLIGVGLGFAMFGRAGGPASPSGTGRGAAPVQVARGTPGSGGVRGFWSVERLAGLAAAEPAVPPGAAKRPAPSRPR